jgi:competence protein ComEC
MDVGQGDAAILISPRGETVLFDDGPPSGCGHEIEYLRRLAVSRIDYLVVSHYHLDHIGCTQVVLGTLPLVRFAYDRGDVDARRTRSYSQYISALGPKRRTAQTGTTIVLDTATPNPATIRIVALNGDGLESRDENDRSVVSMIEFGAFRAVMGGDLSGADAGGYTDVEARVAARVGPVDLYKVHHHCSSYSTNQFWLDALQPSVAVISVGNGNSYGHPSPGCLNRLHARAVRTYWTEGGAGPPPTPRLDFVAGDLFVEVAPNASRFTVTHWGGKDRYPIRAAEAGRASQALRLGNGAPRTRPRSPQPKPAITRPSAPDARAIGPCAQGEPVQLQQEGLVFVTPTGKKYHGPHCSYLTPDATAMPLSEALSKGLTPCSRCGGR